MLIITPHFIFIHTAFQKRKHYIALYNKRDKVVNRVITYNKVYQTFDKTLTAKYI